jgi:hypothetical protein
MEALLLWDAGIWQILLRKGTTPPGLGSGKVSAITAVDVNPYCGQYSTEETPIGLIKAISLKLPTHTYGAGGQVAMHLTGDRSVKELVLLP